MLLYYVFAVAAAAGTVFFLVRGMQMRGNYQTLSRAEKRRAEMLSAREEAEKVTWRDRMRREMMRLGLGEDLFPLYAAGLVAYLAAAAILTALNIPDLAGLLVAFPAAAGIAYGVVAMQGKKRRVLFNRQMIDLLDQLVAQIQGGAGAARALAIISPQMPEPLRTEMLKCLSSAEAGRDLVDALSDLRDKYPSRPMDMFITALEIDRAEGQAIGPALEQASKLLKDNFALSSETDAELSSIKYEFYGVTAIIIGIALALVFTGDELTQESYRTFLGVCILLGSLGNMFLGMWRFGRKINKIKGDA